MPRTEPFEQNWRRYDQWFQENRFAYEAELRAVRELMPARGCGLEIGVGTGRFAAPLGIRHGLEPAAAMSELARRRGIETARGVAERLPYPDARFDFAVMVTTLCFLDDPAAAFAEVHRILKPGGQFLVAFIDRLSPVGRTYEAKKQGSDFYRDATFYSAQEVTGLLEGAAFAVAESRQTIFCSPGRVDQTEPVRPGCGDGGFVVLRAARLS